MIEHHPLALSVIIFPQNIIQPAVRWIAVQAAIMKDSFTLCRMGHQFFLNRTALTREQ